MKKIIVLDGYSLMYRAYHGLRMPMSNGTIMTNCIHGFLMMLFKVIEEEHPDAACVAFDVHAPTFRHESYAEYKAGRSPMPDDMRPQIPEIRALLEEMHIPIIEKAGFEADDIAGTISAIGEKEGFVTVIVTGDRDSYQLAGPNTTILYTKKGITETESVNPEWIAEHYGGLTPAQLIDVKALAGDSSDNIPGIAGIGEKTAVKLVSQYGDLETILTEGPTGQKGKLAERLRDGGESARMSRWLAEINRNAPISFDFDRCLITSPGKALPHMRTLKLSQCIERLNRLFPDVKNPPTAEEAARTPIQLDGTDAVCTALNALPGGKRLALYAGAMLSISDDDHFYTADTAGDLLSPGIDIDAVSEVLRSAAARYEALVVLDVRALPGDFSVLENSLHDVMLEAYVFDPQLKCRDLAAVADACGLTGAAMDSDTLLAADEYLCKSLLESGMNTVYEKIERPLAFVLSSMEQAGFLTDAEVLRQLGTRYTARIAEITEEIYALAGKTFNINSPKQLSQLLFEEMGLPGGKKTSGGYSTNAEVLEELAEQYPICEKILEYRRFVKLNSTYIEALLKLRDAGGRIHTRFDQVSTATGRISSLEPNLQNIPVRTEEGRQIRRAFIAPDGCCLIDADYSQIELRVLAHMSGDETMIADFNSGEDIHRSTAAKVYGVSLEEVTPHMRSSAKAVNFGIVYGISDFGLAKNIGVSRKEAHDFIARYLARYPGVKRYMDDSVESGKRDGYVATLFGRRRYLRELKSPSYTLRQFGERAAMNSPIQGTAADIIKLAMVEVFRRLKAGGYAARLLLQVHDELIIECPLAEKDAVSELLTQCMEHVITMLVPLPAEVSIGGNWNECK